LPVPASRRGGAAMFASVPAPKRTHLAQGILGDGKEDSVTRAHIITGSFGAGKTTAIRWLMSHKPADELWVVILNEFTELGLDALNVAQSARGSYDVRLVAGGCLCCIGELEFGKQLRDILRHLKPMRLLIEPSGAGHAADIVDELATYEGQRALNLDSIVCLVDPLDAGRILRQHEGNEWSQIQSADVLLMSKSDLAGPAERQSFDEIAAAQYPVKRYLGSISDGALPPEALQQYSRSPHFSLLREANPVGPTSTVDFAVGGILGSEMQREQLGLWAIGWVLPRELTFARVVIEPRLNWLIDAYRGWLRRFKAVFRTGPGPSWLVQSHGHGLAGEDSAYRRDSRIEIVLTAQPTEDFLDAWREMLRDAALAPRR
jgi:G3E family GTPase